MEEVTCARPYAQAAFNHAKEHNSLDRWKQMLSIMGFLVQHENVRTMLSSPNLAMSERVTHLIHLLGDEIDVDGKNFLTVLSENKRLLLLPWIAQQFLLLKAVDEKEQEVVVSSAYSLNNQELKALDNKMTQRLGKTIKIKTVIDPSLIGGVKICAGDWVCDDTLKARLDKLANAITT